MAHGQPIDIATATNVAILDLATLYHTIVATAENTNQCIMPGGHFNYPAGQPFNIMSAARMRSQHGITSPVGIQTIDGIDYVARLNDNVTASNIVLFDYDPAVGMPGKFANANGATLVGFLRETFQNEIGFIVTTSTSARVSHPSLTHKPNGYHLYAIVNDPADMQRFKQAWIDRGFLEGWSFMKPNKNGHGRATTVFDPSVIANRGRIDFAGKPFVGTIPDAPSVDGATVHYYPGTVMDTSTIRSVDTVVPL